MKRNEDRLRVLWDNITHTKIHIIGVSEGEEREKGAENMFEDKIAENFPKLGNSHPSPGSIESPIQDKLKEEHTMTHCN